MKNKNLEFFLEIYMEEIPARLVNDLSSQLKNNFEVLMNERGISFSHIKSYGTPMRPISTSSNVSAKGVLINVGMPAYLGSRFPT